MNGTRTVFRDLTREELDRQYDQRTLVPELGPLFAGWKERSAAFAARHGRPERLAYGSGAAEGIDLFEARGAVGLHVHYHGGAWKALDSGHGWWLAEPWLAAGYSFAAVDFDLVPDVSLATQVAQATDAFRRASEACPTDGKVVVSGHSSGAHLAAMTVLAPRADQSVGRCDTLLLASGVYDLEPVRLSARNDYLHLDQKTAKSLSPVRRLLQAAQSEVQLLWARHELAEFRRQSREMARALREAGIAVTETEADVATHFDTWDLITPGLLQQGAD